MSSDRYFLSTAALSIIPEFAFTRPYEFPPFDENTASISLYGTRLVLKKCAPVTIRLPSTAIAGHTKVFDGQKVPHIFPSCVKKLVTGLNRNHARSHAVLSKTSISSAPTRSPVTELNPAAG